MYSILLFVALYKGWRAISARSNTRAAMPISRLFLPYVVGSVALVLYADIFYCSECELREAIGVGSLIAAGLASSAAQRFYFFSQ